MGRAVAIRADLETAVSLRRLAKKESSRRTALRMLAIANAMDGMSRSDAAHAVGIERQSLCDAIKRYNCEWQDHQLEGALEHAGVGLDVALALGDDHEIEVLQDTVAGEVDDAESPQLAGDHRLPGGGEVQGLPDLPLPSRSPAHRLRLLASRSSLLVVSSPARTRGVAIR